MLKIVRLSFCSVKKGCTFSDLQYVQWYYRSGKSGLSISQYVVHPNLATKNLYPNYYIQQQMCAQLQKLCPGFQMSSMQQQQVQQKPVPSIFRLLVKGHIGNKDLGLNINTLKSNQYIKKLMQFKQNGKFVTKTSQIIIDDSITQKPGTEIKPILQPNIMQVEKLIETGLGLPISFMISKSNVTSPTWLKLLTKKRKAIHSDIIQCSSSINAQQKQAKDKKSISLEQFVYNNGFKLQHLFLRPYQRGCPVDLLSDNDSFNLQELIKVLNIIDFEGKIVLQNNNNFASNIEFLDSVLKKCGYQRKKAGQIDLINQYMIL